MKKKTITELRRSLRLANRAAVKAYNQARLREKALYRLYKAMDGVGSELRDEPTKQFIKQMRDAINADMYGDTGWNIREKLSTLCVFMDVQ